MAFSKFKDVYHFRLYWDLALELFPPISVGEVRQALSAVRAEIFQRARKSGLISLAINK
jgi:hypothetical protein